MEMGSTLDPPTKANVDVVIIGGGPAGLATAHACLQHELSIKIIEAGPRILDRNHEDQLALATGVGGAGLFSDGKFSFFPSATKLWQLRPESDLQISYQWLGELLAGIGLTVPDLRSIAGPTDSAIEFVSGLPLKTYPSFYASLEQRSQLIGRLENSLENDLMTDSTVHQIDSRNGLYDVQANCSTGPKQVTLTSKALVLATGRFGPTFVSEHTDFPTVFRRVEIGFRIEQPAREFFLDDSTLLPLDPKIIFSEGALEWRTFCCCRRGEVVTIKSGPYLAVSGRSDVAETDLSNVGFQVRFLEQAQAERVWEELHSLSQSGKLPGPVKLSDFLTSQSAAEQSITSIIGKDASNALRTGLRILVERFGPSRFSNAVLHGPTIEGCGMYPNFNNSLRLQPRAIWGAGDVTGLFRGLVAALVSGYFAGLQAARHVRDSA